jgi:hypothetical protein
MTYKITKQPFGIAFLAMCVSGAFFGNFFETPFGAVPYYLITGLAIVTAPATRRRSKGQADNKLRPSMA